LAQALKAGKIFGAAGSMKRPVAISRICALSSDGCGDPEDTTGGEGTGLIEGLIIGADGA